MLGLDSTAHKTSNQDDGVEGGPPVRFTFEMTSTFHLRATGGLVRRRFICLSLGKKQ